MPVKPYHVLLVEEVLHPFYVFQLVSVVFWIVEQYYYYAGIADEEYCTTVCIADEEYCTTMFVLLTRNTVYTTVCITDKEYCIYYCLYY